MRPLAAAALVLAAAGRLTGADAVDRASRVITLAPGTAIHVHATVADVSITGSARTDLRVDVERRAPGADGLAQFPLSIDERPDGVYIDARQRGDGRDAALKSAIVIAAPSD